MRWLLKCFYGYGNLWDEILFRWVLDHIDTQYPQIDDLTVEVRDVEWMQARWTRNSDLIIALGLCAGFVNHQKVIKFVPLSKNITDNRTYDLYFFWGGEVFAESRGFHGGRNYLLRYPWVIWRKKFVLLWGIETPTKTRQQKLYRFVLPRAQKIRCRDEVSYHVAHSYNKHTLLYKDFAVPVVDRYRQFLHHTHGSGLSVQDDYGLQAVRDLAGDHYIIINMIDRMNTDESYDIIRQVVEQYPDHRLIYVSWASQDDKYISRLQAAYTDLIVYPWQDYTMAQTFFLFSRAGGGVACRLHILLLLQEFERPRYALAYAEKVTKLISSTIEVEI